MSAVLPITMPGESELAMAKSIRRTTDDIVQMQRTMCDGNMDMPKDVAEHFPRGLGPKLPISILTTTTTLQFCDKTHIHRFWILRAGNTSAADMLRASIHMQPWSRPRGTHRLASLHLGAQVCHISCQPYRLAYEHAEKMAQQTIRNLLRLEMSLLVLYTSSTPDLTSRVARNPHLGKAPRHC